MTAAHGSVDLEDVEFLASFRVSTHRIADRYGCSPAWLITKARRAGLYELADRLRDLALDEADRGGWPITKADVYGPKRLTA